MLAGNLCRCTAYQGMVNAVLGATRPVEKEVIPTVGVLSGSTSSGGYIGKPIPRREDLSAAAIHHVYHIVLPTAGFAIYVAIDVRRRGWPTFSWRLS
jgi:hypothetical protein